MNFRRNMSPPSSGSKSKLGWVCLLILLVTFYISSQILKVELLYSSETLFCLATKRHCNPTHSENLRCVTFRALISFITKKVSNYFQWGNRLSQTLCCDVREGGTRTCAAVWITWLYEVTRVFLIKSTDLFDSKHYLRIGDWIPKVFHATRLLRGCLFI
jgi:hypothetical protein